MRVEILFGSEMGTAETAAECIADELSGSHTVSVHDMSDFSIDDLDAAAVYVLVVSTYGDGDLPTGAEPFFDAITLRRPDLTGLRFAVFGLGDSVYGDTFNRGGEIAARTLIAHGAARFGEHARHDASAEVRVRDMARDWARTLPIPVDLRLITT
ncbi:flavodoxin domain-containing protein [Nocardia takedensis]